MNRLACGSLEQYNLQTSKLPNAIYRRFGFSGLIPRLHTCFHFQISVLFGFMIYIILYLYFKTSLTSIVSRWSMLLL